MQGLCEVRRAWRISLWLLFVLQWVAAACSGMILGKICEASLSNVETIYYCHGSWRRSPDDFFNIVTELFWMTQTDFTSAFNTCTLYFFSRQYHAGTIKNVREAEVSFDFNRCIAIALDTKGPEIRTGLLAGVSII